VQQSANDDLRLWQSREAASALPPVQAPSERQEGTVGDGGSNGAAAPSGRLTGSNGQAEATVAPRTTGSAGSTGTAGTNGMKKVVSGSREPKAQAAPTAAERDPRGALHAEPQAGQAEEPQRGMRRLVRRLGWGVADQGMSSLTNFAVTLYVGHTLGATQFGAFSLAYVTYSFALNVSRGLATDPLMVRFSGADQPAWRRAVASSSGTALLVGMITGTLVLVAAQFLSGTTKGAFVALGLMLPGLLLQDSWRFAFFAHGKGSQAFLNDTVWGIALAPSLIALKITGHADVFTFVLIWGASANVAAAVGPLQAKVVPRVTNAWSWMSGHRDLGFRYLAENSSNSGASQLRLYGVGWIVGLAAAGYVQAAGTMMGPFLVIFMGMSLVTIPEASRVLRRWPDLLNGFCALVGICLAAGAVAWAGALWLVLPKGLGHALLPTFWHQAYNLIPALTLSVMGACLIAGATAGLHALGMAKRSLRAMVVSSAAYLTLGLAGAYVNGAEGTVLGAAMATWFGAVVWWWQLQLGLREARRTGQIQQHGRHREPHQSGAWMRGGTAISEAGLIGGPLNVPQQMWSDDREGTT
jgi:O-antigen/teichoic acid export membrane protein